jgi:hypothetical protein
MNERTEHFANPPAVARYAEGPPRIVPGFAHLQGMTTLLLAERVPQNGRVLVLGAGGGLELKVFAEAHPDWRFDGVDPSDEMLKLAALPQKAKADALHIAVATVHGMDYLLTWNCTHIANAIMRPKIESICRAAGYEPPVICTPPELVEE